MGGESDGEWCWKSSCRCLFGDCYSFLSLLMVLVFWMTPDDGGIDLRVCVCVLCCVVWNPTSITEGPYWGPISTNFSFFFWLFFCRLEFIFTIFADSWFFGSWYLTPSACYYTAWGTDLCLHAIHAYPAIPRCSISSPLHLGFLLNRPVSVVLPSFGSLISSSSSIISTFSIHQ